MRTLLATCSLALLASCSETALSQLTGTHGPDDDTVNGGVDAPAPDIRVEPRRVDFGSRPLDCPNPPRTVTVTNVGDQDLDVSSIRLVGPGIDAFSIDGGPAVLAPDGALTFDIGFAALELVAYDLDVEVDSNDPDEPTAGVDVLGVGADDAIFEEVFTQSTPSDVDVLWVVDNSCSMGDTIDLLGDRFDSFLSAFGALDIDYHLSVTSTDMEDPSHQGRFLGPARVISGAHADPNGLFVAAASLGDEGSGDERGMDAAYAALTDPLLESENWGFLREDASLAIVVLSDEEDKSEITNGDFVRWLDALKGDPERTSLSAVVGDYGTGCRSERDTAEAEPGDRYVRVQEQTGSRSATTTSTTCCRTSPSPPPACRSSSS